MERIKKTVFSFLWAFNLVLSACTTPLPSSITPTPTLSANKELTPPALFYVVNNQLYERRPAGSALIRAGIGDEGRILDAVRVKDIVFVLSEKGLQQIEINTGETKMAVEFDKIPLWGELVRTSNDNVLLYSIALDSACSATGIGATIGLYRPNQDTSREVFSGEGYTKPLGLTTDQQSIYGFTLGCDPDFDRFWLISIDQGTITKELQTSDATGKEIGAGEAALSPDSRFLAFKTSHYVKSEDSLKYRVSVYDLDSLTIERYELPRPPSYSDGLLWSPNSQKLYFILNPGTPYDDSSASYGVWSFDVRAGSFTQVTSLDNRFMHMVTISPDGEWMLLQPETEQHVTYVHLLTGQQIVINFGEEGLERIVR